MTYGSFTPSDVGKILICTMHDRSHPDFPMDLTEACGYNTCRGPDDDWISCCVAFNGTFHRHGTDYGAVCVLIPSAWVSLLTISEDDLRALPESFFCIPNLMEEDKE